MLEKYGLKVWAIEARTLANYLLPRDCPRVTFRAGRNSTQADLALLDGATTIVAIETDWERRVREAALFVYGMPPETFGLADAIAGYWTSAASVIPSWCRAISDLPARLGEAGARLVVLPSLWQLHDTVAASSLEYSMIRMRNAGRR